MDDQVTIFVSYSHADAEYLSDESLLGFLRGLGREGAQFWTDERIAVGDKWDDEIRSKIAETDIALVLVSQSFLDSEYCRSVEIEAFLGRSRDAGLVIVPVILSPCEWELHPWLRETQYLPSGGKTIEEHYVDRGPRKRLFLKIRAGLRKQMDRVRQARRAAAETTAQHHVANERRQVTVMHCELTSAAGTPQTLDPEEIVRVLPEYRSRATEILERLGGEVAQRQGQQLMAYFGYPRPHEDDAQRAVTAAREIVALAKDFPGGRNPLAVRAAIHTGTMVVATAADDAEPMLVGDVLEIVAAAMDSTPPNRIYVTDATRDLIEKQFAFSAIGHIEPGDKVELFALEDGSAAETLTRNTFVAREHELEILRQRWELTREGNGQVICIRGQAGMGKSRLVREFAAEVGSGAMTTLECRCSPYHQNTELYPVVDLLRRRLTRVDPDRKNAGDQERLETLVRDFEMPHLSVVPLFSALLSLPLPAGYQPVSLSPEARKKNTLVAVLDMLMQLCAREPVLLIVEDLHWIDASSLGLLGMLIRSQATARILTVLTFRPEFDPPWEPLSHVSELSLGRLASKETSALISLLTDKPIPPDVLAEVVRKSDGIPLFIEELTKMVTEAEHVDAETIGVPATLTGSLIARLDRLDTAKEIAQVASVIGREFSRALLSRIVQVEDAALTRDLDRLLQSEIILRRGLNGGYLFKHVLIQQAAYESILPSDARQLHGRIAEVLESEFPDVVQRQPEIMAFHFTRAGVVPSAIGYWQRAAERSIKNSANPEAVAHLEKCLELLATLPESRERDRHEMKLQTALALPLLAIKGYAAAEVDEALTRAKQLCMQIGDAAELFPVLRLYWSFQAMRGEHRKGAEAGQQMLAMADREDAPSLRLEAHRVLGTGFFYQGRMKEAREHLERAFAFYDRERDHPLVLVYGQDPGVSCLAFASPTLWCMGYPELALARGREAIALARELGHPYSLCFALLFCSWQHIFRRELDTTRKYVEEMSAVAQQQSFGPLETIGTILDGWVQARRGATAAGLEKMTGGLTRWRRIGARVFVPTFLAWIAEIHAEEGDVEAGLAAVEEGLKACDETGEGLCQPELYRLRGELLSTRAPSAAAAEESLLLARELAAAQSARALEFRAAISLAAFWSAAAKEDAARQILEEARGWFPADDASYDVRRADALLTSIGDAGLQTAL